MVYKVYSDDALIFDSRNEDLEIISPALELELNKTGSFTFTIYPSNPSFNSLKKMKSIIQVFQDDFLLFRGRILDDVQGFYNEKQVTCEGELAFLVDSIQRPYDFQTGTLHTTIPALFSFFINNHNYQVEEDRQFLIGNVTVSDSNNYIVCADSTYLNTWDSLNKKLVEVYGGYLFVRHEGNKNYIDYLADFDDVADQTVEFGKNLLDLSKTTKGEDIATAIIPLGAAADGTETKLTIAKVNGGLDYIYDQDAVDKYGWIYKTVEYEDVTTASALLAKGKKALANSIDLLVSIDLDAVDLAAINTDISAFKLGTYINVVAKPHGINSNFLVKKLSISLTSVSSNKLTLGKSYSTFTEQTASVSSNYQSVIKIISDATAQKLSATVEESNFQVLEKVSQSYQLKSDAIQFENSMTSALTQEARQTAILQNGWVALDTSHEPGVYWKDTCGIVHFDGLIKGGTTTANTTLFTLPVGYRPRMHQKFGCISADALCTINVDSTGNVILKAGGSTNWLSLSGITFRAAD